MLQGWCNIQSRETILIALIFSLHVEKFARHVYSWICIPAGSSPLVLFINVVTGAIRAWSFAVSHDNFSIQFMIGVQASLCVLFPGCCGPRLKLIIWFHRDSQIHSVIPFHSTLQHLTRLLSASPTFFAYCFQCYCSRKRGSPFKSR